MKIDSKYITVMFLIIRKKDIDITKLNTVGPMWEHSWIMYTSCVYILTLYICYINIIHVSLTPLISINIMRKDPITQALCVYM